MRAWLEEMKATNIKIVVVSNNNYARVKRAVERFDVAFVSRAMKPFDIGIKKALKSNATFSFESELTQNGVRKVLQISISDMKYSFNNKNILSLHILDITNKVLENREL